tara:strand:+ start:296 stop:727 length:432 start_codon:yes stop_codon:yes gene_type:complete
MIKYNLLCKKCELTFDSWFASSKEYDKLKVKKLINCHGCGSLKVEKNLMAPKLIGKNLRNKNEKNDLINYQKIRKTINEYQKFIKKNFDYVGKNFAHEARSIHYSNKNKHKGIYGTASKQDLKELKEEGIDTQMVPWFENENN